MKKFLAFLTAAILTAAVFTGCGNSESKAPDASGNSQASSQVEAAASSSAYNLTDIVAAVEQANPVSNPRDVDDNFISLDMLLTSENIAEYAGKVSNDQGNSALILAIKAVEGKGAEVKTELEAYKTSISTGGLYAEFADMETMAKDARIVAKGDYLVLVVANTQGADYAEIDKALDEALK